MGRVLGCDAVHFSSITSLGGRCLAGSNFWLLAYLPLQCSALVWLFFIIGNFIPFDRFEVCHIKLDTFLEKRLLQNFEDKEEKWLHNFKAVDRKKK